MFFRSPCLLTGSILGAANFLGNALLGDGAQNPSIVVALSTVIGLFGGCMVWLIKYLLTSHTKAIDALTAEVKRLSTDR